MKIYLVHSSKYDFQNELYLPIKNSGLTKNHEIIFLYDQTQSPGSTKDLIKGCDLIIAEVSYPSLACGIEIGWANAFDIPVIFIHKSDTQPSQFLPIISKQILSYSNPEEMVGELSEAIESDD